VKQRRKENVGDLQARGVVGLTKGQMAAALQVSLRTITEMMRRGEISYFKIGKLVRFRIEDALERMGETIFINHG
jgi:excisionase family DNA binding protein